MGNLLVDPATARTLRTAGTEWPDLVLAGQQLRALELIATGVLAPLEGFMDAAQAHAVRTGGALPDGTVRPEPVVLDVTTPVPQGTTVALRDAEGDLLAALDVTEVFDDAGRTCLSGPLSVIALPTHYDFADIRLSPGDFADRHGAPPVVITDRPLDTAQLDAAPRPLHVLALERDPSPGQVDTPTLVAALRAARPASVTLVPQPPGSDSHAWHHVLAKGYGTTQAHIVAKGDSHITDDALTTALATGVVPGPPVFDPQVQRILQRQFPPPERVGFTVFFTGLSGSGKSTVANALAARLAERPERRVTLLDGDLVRTHLSSELGFSRAHRDLNVTRIGFVAAEVTRHGGIAICAPIAPYQATRQRVRHMVSAAGRFVLVHVATPLAVCEARDRKGLYAKARAGLIAEFTGISDPYESPVDADVVIDTTTGTASEAAAEIVGYLQAEGLVDPARHR